jgi:type II secretory pathway component PulC
MKQALWIVNSAIVGILIISLATLQVLYQEPPQIARLSTSQQSDVRLKKIAYPPSHWEPIFKHDLFGTYVRHAVQPIQKSLVTPVPEMQEPSTQSIPEAKKPEFTPELVLTIKGIIIAADETQNIAMIEDEAKKEGMYHVGDMYKDGQVIKISRNSVVFLRSSGQQEAFYLRKEDADLAMDGPAKWEYIIKKLEPTSWQIDPESFKHEIDSLGAFLSRASVIGTAYQQGSPVGVRIGELTPDSLGALLGLQKGDIIVSINETSVAQARDRVTIFDKIAASKPSDVIIVKLKRDDAEVTQSYKIDYISKAKKMLFSDNKPKDAAKPEDDLKMSRLQEREKQSREFNERHDSGDQQRDAIAQIRKRLLENLRARLQGARASR